MRMNRDETKDDAMRKHEDPQQHLDRHMERAARQYVDGLQRAGIKPTHKLTKAVAERAAREARASYIQDATDVRDHNIAAIVRNHHRRMNQIKRSGALLRLWTCPTIALLFGLLAWYNFTRGDDVTVGIICAVGGLAFLLMLLLGAIFDRPR